MEGDCMGKQKVVATPIASAESVVWIPAKLVKGGLHSVGISMDADQAGALVGNYKRFTALAAYGGQVWTVQLTVRKKGKRKILMAVTGTGAGIMRELVNRQGVRYIFISSLQPREEEEKKKEEEGTREEGGKKEEGETQAAN